MKINKKVDISIATFYDVGDTYPYIVKYFVNGRVRKKTFYTKFFAALHAKKVAKMLGVEPDLSFEPIID